MIQSGGWGGGAAVLLWMLMKECATEGSHAGKNAALYEVLICDDYTRGSRGFDVASTRQTQLPLFVLPDLPEFPGCDESQSQVLHNSSEK